MRQSVISRIGSLLLLTAVVLIGLMTACTGADGAYKTISGKDYSMQYNASWYLDTLDPDFDPDSYFLVSSPENDAFVSVFIYPRAMDEDARLEQQLDQHVDQTLTKASLSPVDQWAGIKGKGVIVNGALMGQQDNELMIFIHSDSNRSFQVVTQIFANDRKKYQPALKAMESSFKWKQD